MGNKSNSFRLATVCVCVCVNKCALMFNSTALAGEFSSCVFFFLEKPFHSLSIYADSVVVRLREIEEQIASTLQLK